MPPPAACAGWSSSQALTRARRCESNSANPSSSTSCGTRLSQRVRSSSSPPKLAANRAPQLARELRDLARALTNGASERSAQPSRCEQLGGGQLVVEDAQHLRCCGALARQVADDLDVKRSW